MVRHALVGWGLLAIFMSAFALPAGAENATFARAGSLAAVRGYRGLEMRDAFNRPVEREELARGIRSGVREDSDRAAALSALPGLRALIDYLDRLDQLASKLRAPGRVRGQAAYAVAYPAPKEPKALEPAARAGVPLPLAVPAGVSNPLQYSQTPGRVRVLPLLL